MTRLILIRHGESKANRQGTFAGHTDVELEERGIIQAKKTAEYIRNNYNVDKVYASDLQRAFKTGQAVADLFGLEASPDKRFREIAAGEWEGQRFIDIIHNYREEYSVWLNDIGNSRCTNGESVRELGERIISALLDIAEKNPEKTVVIATHATPIRVTQCILSEKTLDKMKDIPWVSNASVTEIVYNNGKWSLEKIGEDAHLSDIKTDVPANV